MQQRPYTIRISDVIRSFCPHNHWFLLTSDQHTDHILTRQRVSRYSLPPYFLFFTPPEAGFCLPSVDYFSYIKNILPA